MITFYTYFGSVSLPFGIPPMPHAVQGKRVVKVALYLRYYKYEGWNFNSGNYLFTTDTK